MCVTLLVVQNATLLTAVVVLIVATRGAAVGLRRYRVEHGGDAKLRGRRGVLGRGYGEIGHEVET